MSLPITVAFVEPFSVISILYSVNAKPPALAGGCTSNVSVSSSSTVTFIEDGGSGQLKDAVIGVSGNFPQPFKPHVTAKMLSGERPILTSSIGCSMTLPSVYVEIGV